jgi:hypothetical protein
MATSTFQLLFVRYFVAVAEVHEAISMKEVRAASCSAFNFGAIFFFPFLSFWPSTSKSMTHDERRGHALIAFSRELELSCDSLGQSLQAHIQSISRLMSEKTMNLLSKERVLSSATEGAELSIAQASQELTSLVTKCQDLDAKMAEVAVLAGQIARLKEEAAFLEGLVEVLCIPEEGLRAKRFKQFEDSERFWEARLAELQKAYDNK